MQVGQDNKDKLISFIIVLLAFTVYMWFAFKIPSQQAPDEFMRLDLSKFIINHGYLPIGNESELRSIWGFSYGFLPYLTSIFGAVVVKILSFFTSNEAVVLLGFRFGSVLAGTGVVIMTLKIGKLIFNKKSAAYLLAVLCGFLPQFVFLSAYLNNDVFAVFASSLIIYFWILGIRKNWEYKICIGLGISLGLCFLSYYNAYAFILCSFFVYTITFLRNNRGDWKTFIKKGLVIFSFAFLVAGWYFIRAFINNGDFLGFRTIKEYGELYAIPDLKPSNRTTASEIISLKEMLTTYVSKFYWIKTTLKSYIGVFGYMGIFLSRQIYVSYTIFFVTGIFSFFYNFLKNIKKISFNKWVIIINLLLCIMIPVVLSIYYSYTQDFQAQGRYIMSSLIPVMLIMTFGISELTKGIRKKLPMLKFDLNYLFIISYLGLFIWVAIKYMTIMFV